jgi:hypothetical protein
MSLFTPYEERPPFCQAVPVWFDTMEQIAEYFSNGKYESTLRRGPWGMRLHITHEDTEHYPGGCDLTIELPFSAEYAGSEHRRQMLVYGHPPTLDDYEEFHKRWRETKEPVP